jgi:hypothetical protein
MAAPPPTEAYGASGPTRTEDVVRWAYFLSLSLVVGGLGFALLVLRGVPPAVASRLYKLIGLGVVATLEVGILGFILRAEGALQLPFGKLLYADLTPIASGTRVGAAFMAMTMGFVLVAFLVYFAWLLDRVILLWPAFFLALGFSSGLSLSGHQAADRGSSWGTELGSTSGARCSGWVGSSCSRSACGHWPESSVAMRSCASRGSRPC